METTAPIENYAVLFLRLDKQMQQPDVDVIAKNCISQVSFVKVAMSVGGNFPSHIEVVFM